MVNLVAMIINTSDDATAVCVQDGTDGDYLDDARFSG